MPKCGEKFKHAGESYGHAFEKSEDDSWDAAKDSVRYWALMDAAAWALSVAAQCPKDCPFRRLDVVIDEIPDPTCVRRKATAGGHKWDCEVKCKWNATVSCRKKPYSTPTDERGRAIDGGISKRRLLPCDEEAWDEGTGQGEGVDADKKKAAEKATRRAIEKAYAEAADKAKLLRCRSACPKQHVRISVGAPTDPDPEKGDDGNWTASSNCDFRVIVDCD